jgi:hypothetical protein
MSFVCARRRDPSATRAGVMCSLLFSAGRVANELELVSS